MKQEAYDKNTKQPLNISIHALDHKQNERNNQVDIKFLQIYFNFTVFKNVVVSIPLSTAYVLDWCKKSRISTFWDTGEEEEEEGEEEEERKQTPVLTNISPYGKYLIIIFIIYLYV